jgi:hypothetical protein
MKQEKRLVILFDTGMQNHMIFERIDSKYDGKSTIKIDTKRNLKVNKNK